MNKYIGILKEGVKYNKKTKTSLNENNIKVKKHLKSLNILVFESEDKIHSDWDDFFQTIDEDKVDYTV